jgi:transposase
MEVKLAIIEPKLPEGHEMYGSPAARVLMDLTWDSVELIVDPPLDAAYIAVDSLKKPGR